MAQSCCRLSAVLLAFVAAGATLARAQLPVTDLFALSPPGGKAGTTVDLTITAGQNLEGVNRLYFSRPGITAAQKMAELKPLQTAPDPLPNQFTVTIAADVPPGVYDVRAIGTFGMSNPRSFVVGDLPEVKEQPGNNVQEKSQPLELNSVVSGNSDGAASDWYKFAAKAGQRVILDCWAQRIDSRMDATLVVFDAAGKQLARSRDDNRRDPLVDLAVPADGEYFVRVYDFVFAGGAEYFYRLSLGIGPYIDFILPPSGVPGTKGAFTIYGRNLPGGAPAEGVAVAGRPLEKLAVEIDVPAGPPTERLSISGLVEPEDSALDGFEYRLKSPQGTSNPYFLGFAANSPVLEQEPNDEPAQPNLVTVPCEFVGGFGPKGDQDRFQFEAKKGDVFWVEVFSQRLGLPTDAAVLLQRVTKNDKGEELLADLQDLDDEPKNVGGLSFNTATDDPLFRFVVPDDGLYRATVRDLNYGGRSDPRRIYRVAVRREQPDFRLAAVPHFPAPNPQVTGPWNPLLRRGGSERVDVFALRRDGFVGEIVVTAEGLPEGVTCPPALIPAGQDGTTLILSAAEQAPAFAGTIQIVGRAKIGEADVARQARSGTVLFASPQPNVPAHARAARSLALAVAAAETAPLVVELGESKTWEMARAGKLEIPVKLVRRGEIKGNLTFTPQHLPPNVQPQPLTFDGNTNEGKLQLQINPNAPLGTFNFYLQAQATVGYRRDPAAAEAAAKAKMETDKLAADLAAKAKESETAKQTADKAAADAAAAAQAAEKAKQDATAAAKQAADEAKAAADKAAAAKAAADAQAGNQDLAKAKEAADKAAADAAAKAKTAADAQAAAEKAAADATAKAKTAAEAKAAAEKAFAEATAKAKAAADLKAAADKRADETAKAAAPRDVAVFWPSTNTTLKITAAPITVASGVQAALVKQGAKVEIPVTLTRLYGYADPVQLAGVLPAGVKGLKIAEVMIAAGQNEGKLVIEAAADATPGIHALLVRGTATFNGQKPTADQTINLTVEKVEQAK